MNSDVRLTIFGRLLTFVNLCFTGSIISYKSSDDSITSLFNLILDQSGKDQHFIVPRVYQITNTHYKNIYGNKAQNKNPHCRVLEKKAYHFDKLSHFRVLHTMKTEENNVIDVFFSVKLLFFSLTFVNFNDTVIIKLLQFSLIF
jgi:hypothetical protein